MTYQILFTWIGIAIGFISYAFYFKGIFQGQTKPHVFSWLVWALVNWTIFFAQIVSGGGFGSYITATNAVLCSLVAILAINKGEKNITLTDKLSFAGALLGIVVWKLTANPLFAVLIICLVDILAIYPTFRKSYYKPFEENVFSFAIDLIKFILQLFALQSFNLTTALFPVVVLVNDTSLVTMILIRRKILKQKSNLL
jgi:hypothetical protein